MDQFMIEDIAVKTEEMEKPGLPSVLPANKESETTIKKGYEAKNC